MNFHEFCEALLEVSRRRRGEGEPIAKTLERMLLALPEG